MTLIDFPTPKESWTKPKTLEDWPWEKELGKPYGDINGSLISPELLAEADRQDMLTYGRNSKCIANPPEQEVNDLVRYKDAINPPHYKEHPSGIECIQITEHMNFCCGNAVKYIWRHAMKGGKQDLEKAIWYLQRELRREAK
jgi:hypothetical protein